MAELDFDEFVADVFDYVGDSGQWPHFLAQMLDRYGYSEDDIEAMFCQANERSGRSC